MKILFCDIEFDYGDKKRGPNTIRLAFQDAFRSLGHTLASFYYDDFIAYQRPPEALQILLLERVESIKPDLIFFSLCTFQFAFETLDRLKEKFVTICWFGDDTWRFADFTRFYAPHFTWCITTDKFSVEKYAEVGQHNVVLSQWAAIDNIPELPIFDGKFIFDVSFVGQYNPFREWLLERLSKTGIQVEAFGKGWENGIITGEKMGEVFLRSKINLNISNSVCHDVRFILSTPKNLYRYFRYTYAKNMGQIKARNFEIPYFGGFQLTDYFPGIEEYFEIGGEVACYKDVDEVSLLIKYYLEHDGLRNEIAKRGQKRAMACHGYKNRVKAILEAIGLK